MLWVVGAVGRVLEAQGHRVSSGDLSALAAGRGGGVGDAGKVGREGAGVMEGLGCPGFAEDAALRGSELVSG